MFICLLEVDYLWFFCTKEQLKYKTMSFNSINSNDKIKVFIHILIVIVQPLGDTTYGNF